MDNVSQSNRLIIALHQRKDLQLIYKAQSAPGDYHRKNDDNL
jgi:hypothetical protein